MVYVWKTRELDSTLPLHKNGFVSALRIVNNLMYSGGKDGMICITDITSMQVVKSVEVSDLVRGLDGDGLLGGFIVTGLRNGDVFKIDLNNDSRVKIQESHSDGEVWGLAVISDTHFATSGDDNKIKLWNIQSKKCDF
jgi:WD40 repeat protein